MNRAPRGAARQPELAPPHDLDAEEAALACMLGSAVARAEARERVSADDFCRPRNGHIFEAICQLEDGGEPVDSVTAYDQLRRLRLADVVTSGDLVALAANGLPTFAFAAKYGAIVAELAAKGRLAAVGAELSSAALDPARDRAEVRQVGEAALLGTEREDGRGAVVSAADTIGLVADRARAAANRSGVGLAGLPTGYRDLDALLGGCEPGALVVVGARPSMGKTAFALGMPLSVRSGTTRRCSCRRRWEQPRSALGWSPWSPMCPSKRSARGVSAMRNGDASNGCRRHSPPPCSRLWTRPARREARSGSPGREGPSRVGARVNRLPPAPGPAREKRTAQARDRRDGLAPEDDGP